MGNRGTARRRIGVAFAVGTAAIALPLIAASPAHAAEIISSEGSVTVESYPSTKQVHVDKFDDDGGLFQLTEVTVTGTVEGELEGSVKNLSGSKEKTLNGEIAASIKVNGLGVTDLEAVGTDSTSWTLAPGETQALGLAGTDSSQQTITDADLLDDFIGVGTLDYDVFSEVKVQIDGPAPYKTTGVAGGEATVKIEYTYTDVCAEDPEDPICVEEPPCETSQLTIDDVANGDYAIPGGGTFTISNLLEGAEGWTFDWSVADAEVESITVQGGEPLGSIITDILDGVLSGTGLHAPADDETGDWLEPSSVIVCASSSETPPECVTATDKIDPVTEGDHELSGGGTFTILDKEDLGAGEIFDWTSNVPIFWISVKGGPQDIDEQFYDYQPDGSFGDNDLHAPFNPNSGKWYGLSHLTLCAGDLDCEANPDAEGCGEIDPCVIDPESCEPPPTCEDDPTMEGCDPASNQCVEAEGFKVDPVTEGQHEGIFTITDIYNTDDGQVFDWTSTVPILSITVKGGPVDNDPEFYSYAPDGATSGTGLHAPLNPNNGKWYGLSHLCVAADEPTGPAGLVAQSEDDPAKEEAPEEEPAEAKKTPPAKIEKAPAPKQEEAVPEPEPEPDPEPEPEPKAEEPPPPPPPAPDEPPAENPSATDAPAGE